MPAYFESLRSRLLEAGVKPRHVTRYLNELREHLEDLIAKEEGGGQTYSTVTKFDLYVLPLLCGWALSVLATRHRMSFVWPIIGFSVIAVFCGLQSFNVDWASAPNQLNSFGTTWAFLPGVAVTRGLVF